MKLKVEAKQWLMLLVGAAFIAYGTNVWVGIGSYFLADAILAKSWWW